MGQLLQHIEPEKLSEMAMVDIAFEILKEVNRPFHFRELMNEIAALRGLTEEQTMAVIAQVYTEVNIDGRFVCLGDNTWGLKRWYSTEAVEETQEGGGKKRKVLLDDDFDYEEELDEELADEYEEDDDIDLYEEDDEFADDVIEDDDLDVDPIEEDDELFEDEELVDEDFGGETNEENEDL